MNDSTHRAWESSWINGPNDELEFDLTQYTRQELLEFDFDPKIKAELLTRPDPDYTELYFDSQLGCGYHRDWEVWNDELARLLHGHRPCQLTETQATELRKSYYDICGSLHPQITLFPWWLPHVFPHLPKAKCHQLSLRVLREYKDLLLNT